MVFRIFKYFLLLFTYSFAFEIQHDASDSFVFKDKVLHLGESKCKNENLFMPENSSFLGSDSLPGIPYRTYIIALPSGALPSVQVENLKSKVIKGEPCGEKKHSLIIGKPYLKDNLWRVKISVPLIYSTGVNWNLRSDFRVKIKFNGIASNYSANKRTAFSVKNKIGASRFAIKQSSIKPLKKDIAGTNIDWLVRIGIGSTDLSVSEDGMYALSFDNLKKALQNVGKEADIEGVQISQLRLFGSTPDTLPEAIPLEEMFPSKVEIPIQIKDKNNNRSFDSGDSLVFFGYGTALWKKYISNSGMDYYFSSSPYSFYQYFYLGVAPNKNENYKELKSSIKNIPGTKEIVWKKYARSEKDLILRDHYDARYPVEDNTGKEWFWFWGNKTSDNSAVNVYSSEFQNSVKNLKGLQNDSVWLGVSFLPRRSYSGYTDLSTKPLKERMEGINFEFNFQGSTLPNSNITDTIPEGTFVFAAKGARDIGNSYNVKILPSSQNSRFDGLSVAYEHNPSLSNGEEWLFTGAASGAIKIPVPAGTELVRVENFIPQEIIEAENGFANDILNINSDVKYYLHKKLTYKTPAILEAIPKRKNEISQPLDILSETEYLIITSEVLQDNAIGLKDFREGSDVKTSYKTEVILVEDIYREHGAQNSPVAIRDFLRYAKNKSPKLRYVLLAGSGNYDYRKIKKSSKNNIIPPYEAETLSSDDFFAILESGERITYGNYELALAIGRLPVSNAIEFNNYIQKIKDYESVSVMNNDIWRNTFIFNGDDAMQGPNIDGIRDHTAQMEETANLVDNLSRSQGFATEQKKISLLQYEINGNGKKPEATRELLLRLNQGALFTIFYGHGGNVQWADEDLLNVNSLSSLYNKNKYTILGSFSCEVGRFDDINTISLSEAFISAKDKGAIASIGALRLSFPNRNKTLAERMLEQALFSSSINTIGEAMQNAKNLTVNSFPQRYNNEKYSLLGEPVLGMPRKNITFTLDNVPDTIQALQKLSISGTASIPDGFVRMQVLEGEKQKKVEQNLGNGEFYSTNISVSGNPIYNEELKIINGKFSTEFITPRKLSFGDSSAEIRLWAYKNNYYGMGSSVKDSITLYGTDTSYADSIKDNTAPSVKIYPCMRAGSVVAPFEENAKVSLEIPACLDVVIEDSTGIDYREEADEGISFEVVGVSLQHPWAYSEQTGKRAVARMNFGDSYSEGEYTFKVQAQDILGNVAVRSMKVLLTNENKEGLTDVFNAPNPIKNKGTTFYFKDLAGDRLSNVSIKIFDQNGKLVKTINNAISGITHWDGRDSRGRLLANGLYYYVVKNTVSSVSSGKKNIFEKKQKLLISR